MQQRVRLLTLAMLLLAATSLSPAVALTNGPVSTTLSSTTYSVFYTTIQYSKIVNNMTAGGGANATSKYSTSSPNAIDGLGSNTKFMQPWWNPTNSSAALTAATAWYNASGWPKNDGLQYPNGSGAVTPFFAYGTINSGAQVVYVALDSSGNPIYGNKFVNEDGFSYALAGISN